MPTTPAQTVSGQGSSALVLVTVLPCSLFPLHVPFVPMRLGMVTKEPVPYTAKKAHNNGESVGGQFEQN